MTALIAGGIPSKIGSGGGFENVRLLVRGAYQATVHPSYVGKGNFFVLFGL